MKPKIKVKGYEELRTVDINTDLASEIKEAVVTKWQEILDLATQMLDVPNALIMRLHENNLEVFARSSNKENIFKQNHHAQIGIGHYCETVMGTNDLLLVKDSQKDPLWKDNPDVHLGLVHYLGLPLTWPDGEVFGTMCVLDSEEKNYSQAQFDLFNALKSTIEKDLSLVDRNVQLNKAMDMMERTQDILVSHEKNHLTNQLVSNITHEISTPIGVALTTASYLDYVAKHAKSADEESMEKLREGAMLLQRNLEQASSLIRSFKQIANDQGRKRTERIDLEFYVESIIGSLKYDLRKHQVKVDINIPSYTYISLETGSFGQVLINLIVNASNHAFKTMKDNQILIHYEDCDEKFKLIIEDNGIGISQDQLETVFEPFVRFDKDTEGSGLGLTIVKDLVNDSLNGSIQCESLLNKGTKFIIELEKKSS